MRFFTSVCLATILWGSCQCAAQDHTDAQDAAAEPGVDAAVFGEGVRPTSWLDPQAEKDGMHLRPGFEIRLFASEPQIAKPLNMAFDASRPIVGHAKSRVSLSGVR